MDRREMKKQIQYLALEKLSRLGGNELMYELELILDKTPTIKQLSRFSTVLREMRENAESKI